MIVYEHKTNPIDIFWHSGMDFVSHVHKALELVVCMEGTLSVSCRYCTRLLRPGDVMIAFSHDIHAYHRTEFGGGVLMIVMPGVLSLFASRLSTRQYDNFYCEQDPEMMALAQAIYQARQEKKSTDILVGHLYILLGTLLQKLPYRPAEERPEDRDLFTRVLEYLSANYTQPLSLESVAEQFGISPSHLCRTFADKLSCGYLDYLHQLRVEYAQDLLTGTDRKICEIAFACGFSDQRSFNRVFRKRTGMTPRDYRRTGPERLS